MGFRASKILLRAAPLASLCLAACGVIVGIKPLEVTGEDEAGVKPRSEGGASDGGVDSTVLDDSGKLVPAPQRPPEGRYVYGVDGGDRVSGFVNFNNGYGPTATIDVVYADAGCFKETVTLRQDYVETLDFCIRGAYLVESGGTRNQKFGLGVSASTTQSCTPGDVYFTTQPGPQQTWDHVCMGSNTDDKSGNSAFKTAGKYRFDGVEPVMVGGLLIQALHFHDERAITGSQTGTNVADWYLKPDDGMPMRLVRDIMISYPSPVGMIKYTEAVEMTLQAVPGAKDGG